MIMTCPWQFICWRKE